MVQASKQGFTWHKRGCALVAVLAVCALTVKLTTRFEAFDSAATPGIVTVQQHTSPAPNRQRLMGTATAWSAPIVRVSLLDSTSSYTRIAPAGPPVPSAIFEQSLYNRPPPRLIPGSILF